MYKHCSTEESVSRQRQFEQCLLKLMHTVSYPQISIVQLCAQTGLSRKCFYRYFGSKDDCLAALIDHAIMDGSAYYFPERNEHTYARGAYERFFTYWKSMASLLTSLDKSNLLALLTERMILNLEREEWGIHHTRTSREHLVFIAGGIISLVMEWHRTGYRKSIQEMAAILETVLAV